MEIDDTRAELRQRQMLPHQVDFISTVLGSPAGGRFLLGDPPGLGRSHACMALVWAWARQRGRLPRTLVLAPGPMLPTLRALLGDFETGDVEIVDAKVFRRFEATTHEQESPWLSAQTVLTTVEFVNRDDRLATLLAAPWDLVFFFDEFLVREEKALSRLWGSSRVDSMIVVMSFDGTARSRAAASYTRSLSPKLSESWMRDVRELRDWEGAPLLGKSTAPIVEVVTLDLSILERRALERLVAFVQRDPSAAMSKRLAYAAASSLLAFEQSIRRALIRSHEQAHSPFAEISSQPGLFPELSTQLALADLGSRETHAALETLLPLIDAIELDTKSQACLQVLKPEIAKRGASVLVFCGLADTAHYVSDFLADLDSSVGVVTAAMPQSERSSAVDRFGTEGGILVVTPATTEGLQTPHVKLCVHYDAPWTHTDAARRLGVTHRAGAPPGPVRHVFFADELVTYERFVREVFDVRKLAGSALGLLTPSVRFEFPNPMDLIANHGVV